METTRSQLYKKCPIPNRAAFLSFWEKGEIDEATIEATLKRSILGKKFDPYGSGYDLIAVFRTILAQSNEYQSYANNIVARRDTPQEYTVYYKNGYLFGFSIKKKKGRWHSGYFIRNNGYYDWTVDSVEISNFPKNLYEKFIDIGMRAAIAKRLKEEETERLYKMYRLIREGSPTRNKYDICSDLRKLVEKMYEFGDRYGG